MGSVLELMPPAHPDGSRVGYTWLLSCCSQVYVRTLYYHPGSWHLSFQYRRNPRSKGSPNAQGKTILYECRLIVGLKSHGPLHCYTQSDVVTLIPELPSPTALKMLCLPGSAVWGGIENSVSLTAPSICLQYHTPC
jgi:hypothetical protein